MDQIGQQSPGYHERTALHVCERCESGFVQPVTWTEKGAGVWEVALRCPECEHWREGVFSQDLVDALDEILDAGTDALAVQYRQLICDNLAAEIERFEAALAADAILPEDF